MLRNDVALLCPHLVRVGRDAGDARHLKIEWGDRIPRGLHERQEEAAHAAVHVHGYVPLLPQRPHALHVVNDAMRILRG